MRFFSIFFVVFCLVAAIYAIPAGDKKKQVQGCHTNCDDKYSPICGNDISGKKLITFGNNCLMERYNCQHPDGTYQLKIKNECGGNAPVLLS